MTISVQTQKTSFIGNGVTKNFPYSFYVFSPSYIKVIVTTGGVESVKVLNTDYTVSDNGNETGGTVSFITAPASGDIVTVKRVLPHTQSTDYQNNSAFHAEILEGNLDYLTAVTQQLKEQVSRAPLFAESSTFANITLPDPVAKKALRWNDAGTGLVNSTNDFDTVVADVITQANAAAASAVTAATQAGIATTQAGVATVQATNAAGSATDAATSAATAASIVGNAVVSQFSGNGSTVAFTLPVDPIHENNIVVTVNGVTQHHDTYSTSGTTLTFSAAPPTGTNNIEVVIRQTVPVGVPSDSTITTIKIVDGAITDAKINDVAWSKITSKPTTVSGYGISDAVTLTGTQTLTNKTLGATSLPGGGQIGSSGHIFLGDNTASPELRLKGGTGAGVGPLIRLQRGVGNDIGYVGSLAGVVGGNSDDVLIFAHTGKGIALYAGAANAGYIASDKTWTLGGAVGSESLRVSPTTSQVNCIQITGSAASNPYGPVISTTGSDANVPMMLQTKGAQGFGFSTNGTSSNIQFVVAPTTGAQDYITVTGGTSEPYFYSAGSSASANMAFYTKGSGVFKFTNSSGQDAIVNINANGTSRGAYINLDSTVSGSNYSSIRGSTSGIENWRIGQSGSLNTFSVFTGSTPIEQFRVSHAANAVNYLRVTGSATGQGVYVAAQGSDADIPLQCHSKGSSPFNVYTNGISSPNLQFSVGHIANAVNYLRVTGNATGGSPYLFAQGSDSNVGIGFVAKSGQLNFYTDNTGSGLQFSVGHTANTVNYLSVTGNVTTASPSISFTGSDSTVNGVYAVKGAGNHQFISGGGTQFLVANAANAVNNLVVSGAATATAPYMAAQGADSNIGIQIASKGYGGTAFIGNGVQQMVVASTASAVNYAQITGGTTGNGPGISPQGADTNCSLNLCSKGTGGIVFFTRAGGAGQFVVADAGGITANYAQIKGGTTGVGPEISAQGSDANVALNLISKGSYGVGLSTGGLSSNYQLVATHTASAVNYAKVTGSTTGNRVTYTADGSDTNIGLYVQGKGTGGIVLGQSSGSIGLFGGSGTTKQTVTGSRGGNAALASLLTALANYGLITDSTTA